MLLSFLSEGYENAPDSSGGFPRRTGEGGTQTRRQGSGSEPSGLQRAGGQGPRRPQDGAICRLLVSLRPPTPACLHPRS